MTFNEKLEALNIVPIDRDRHSDMPYRFEYMYNSTEHDHVYSRQYLESTSLEEIQRKLQQWL